MKKIFVPVACFAAILAVVSCSPKIVAMQPSDPNVPQMPNAAATLPTTEAIAHGKSLYQENCARCHKLFEPQSHTREEWKPILAKMQVKAQLGDEDMALISTYINSETK
jgi:cytochrome c5